MVGVGETGHMIIITNTRTNSSWLIGVGVGGYRVGWFVIKSMFVRKEKVIFTSFSPRRNIEKI